MLHNYGLDVPFLFPFADYSNTEWYVPIVPMLEASHRNTDANVAGVTVSEHGPLLLTRESCWLGNL